jgi:phenylacetate-CoA ligase
VFQYDPCDYHVETLTTEAGPRELVITVCRPMLSPRIRYNVGDEGGTISFDVATAACRALGLDAHDSEPQPFRLPFLFVHGRADQTMSFMGANLYPEDVAAGIDAHPTADRLGAFCMEIAEVNGDDVRPFIHIEAPAALRHDRVAAELVAVIRDHLAADSADYREALLESPRAGDLQVRLWEPGTGPFVANASRIKHRQVLKASTPTTPASATALATAGAR